MAISTLYEILMRNISATQLNDTNADLFCEEGGPYGVPLLHAEPTPIFPSPDEVLKTQLLECAKGNAEYWSFRGNAQRERAHSYFQYPAMMVPQIQYPAMMVPQMLGQLIRTIASSEGNIRRIYDPFVGSGTVLGETLSHGIDFEGQDINPLAILVSRAKCGPYNEAQLREAITRVWESIDADQSKQVDVDFPNLQKWFYVGTSISLSRVRRAIKREEQLWVRRFLWVALAETVRLSSNSRTSTFKLHKRDDMDLLRRQHELDAIATFRQILAGNFSAFLAQRRLLVESGFLDEDGVYLGEVHVRHQDSSTAYSGQLSDLLVTSPPYGDNHTTVPYGQSAYLPLQWIDLEDIDGALTDGWLASTHAIDSKSLGGSLKDAKTRSEVLREISPSFKLIMSQLESKGDSSLMKKVQAFCADFHRCISPTVSALRHGSVMVWVVGNRCVGGHVVPFDEILADLLRAEHATEIISMSRSIHSKRMPGKNRSASTMGKETIMVWRTAR